MIVGLKSTLNRNSSPIRSKLFLFYLKQTCHQFRVTKTKFNPERKIIQLIELVDIHRSTTKENLEICYAFNGEFQTMVFFQVDISYANANRCSFEMSVFITLIFRLGRTVFLIFNKHNKIYNTDIINIRITKECIANISTWIKCQKVNDKRNRNVKECK